MATTAEDFEANTDTAAAVKSRIASIDIMRGLIIILMMMDHVRERFFMHTPIGDPINLDVVGVDLFFTRYPTHLCAPMFIFLTGLSAWLYAHPANGQFRSPTGFLFKRGLFLVFIEVVVIFLVWADSFSTIWLSVIWAIGVCMIALSVLHKLNHWMIGALGLLIVFGHNALIPLSIAPDELGYSLWAILHDRGDLFFIGEVNVRADYPVLPWIGVILLGYFAGPLYGRSFDALSRRKILIGLGAACIALLLVLRGFNIYGETLPWTVQETAVGTVMSFLNFTKYPPSLNFLLITLGIGSFLLAWLESMQNRQGKLLDAIEVYGSVPMFIYILHLYTLLAAYLILFRIFGVTHGERFGFDEVWWIWVGAVVLTVGLYFPTKAFADFKHREKRNKRWLSYF